jgi:uncharacterized damage-inducible protein DinB
MARTIVESIEAEYRRYKALADGALAQVSDEEICRADSAGDNAIVAIVWHLSGNLASRFENFRTGDGEKSWRDRESEFDGRQVTREEWNAQWNRGWDALFGAIAPLADADLDATVTIRRQPLRIDQALLRSVTHAAYHVGQIVYLAKQFRGAAWKSLSIPRGMSEAYNQSPANERAEAHAAALRNLTRPPEG